MCDKSSLGESIKEPNDAEEMRKESTFSQTNCTQGLSPKIELK